MYKKFSIEELSTIQNNLIPHLYTIIQREKCQWVNDFFKIAFHEWNEVIYFDRWNPLLSIQLLEGQIHITDEIDNIQIQIPENDKSQLNHLMIRYISKKQKQIWQRTIEQILMDKFVEWTFFNILSKPYIVYDIETSLISWEISKQDLFLFHIVLDDVNIAQVCNLAWQFHDKRHETVFLGSWRYALNHTHHKSLREA